MNSKNAIFMLFACITLLACKKDNPSNYSHCRLESIETKVIRKNPNWNQTEIARQGTNILEYESDRTVKLSYFDEKGVLTGWYAYEYNSKGLVRSITFHDNEFNQIDTVQKHTYDESGNLLQVILVNNSGSGDNTILNFAYPDPSSIIYSFDEYEYRYNYDSSSNLVEVVTTKYNADIPYFRTFYLYDQAKNPYYKFPLTPFDPLLYFSKANLIGHSGTTDSTLIVDPSQLVYNIHTQLTYNSANYPIEIIEDRGSTTYERRILNYHCD